VRRDLGRSRYNASHNLARPSIAPKTCLHAVRADAVVVPGLWLSSANDLRAPLQKLAPVIRALRELPKETQVWSYCAGVLPVAAAGDCMGNVQRQRGGCGSHCKPAFHALNGALMSQ
jgi:hypothetical protein